MKDVALVIDNSAAMSKQDCIKTNVVKEIPISFIINGEEYYENINMTYQDFYAFLKRKDVNVSTSQPSIETIKEEWRKILKEYKEIVYIILSSGLSEACNTALNASHLEEFEGRVFVVNNQRVSYANKIAMYEASILISQGKSGKEVKEYLENTKAECGIYIAVDSLKYLKKGGRITPAAAAIGTLLNIKPILQIHGGRLDAYAKVMSMKQAKTKMITAMRKEIEEKYPQELKDGKIIVSTAHTMEDLNSQELALLIQTVKDAFPDCKFYVGDPLPLFIACHTGSGALGVGYAVDRLGVIEKMNKQID